ncbi:EscC/YscC/HrcC family type III secretion system outer membrane ring protein [Pseudomonas azotoformans]|uniref:EscC/YscC/HrcC family type III secretion system outer membrane ring protein n=1 Tax=Pseudomonas azotoformans TaxID=47878 RepID=A0A1V2JS98_PSEAZ|nr:type III secretion system outer membrane ring subunit SctC [Pseudomonas azotoformans]OIN49135.1 EscC/YscC/HrcC family type III secretion system outer membrane ring protein [Pseudomonas azotoformans]ONH48358.1 EscC/YscC/HrcC family type III secretion system outer membrane ring protein [Pseudomonas azotoformans]
MPRLRFHRWLLFAGLWLLSAVAWGELYQVRNESLYTVFTALSEPLGVPIVVSQAVARKRLSTALDFDAPQQTLEALALEQGLIWYGDGQVLHIYDADEAKSSAVTLRHITVDKLRGLMRRSGLDESRYPLRESGARTFYVSGPPNYVDQVMRLAQLMDRQRADLRVGAQAFAVVQVLNTDVADRQYGTRDNPVTVPGMASMIETLLASEHKGLLSDKSLGVIAYPDSNSLLIKGKPAQVSFIQKLVAELDAPKRPIEVSLWLVDVERTELEKLGLGRDEDAKTSTTRILAPLDDNRVMARIGALERRRRATVVTLPVILTQENVPAVFQDSHTFYLPSPGNDRTDWKPVRYGTQVSVLPRFSEANQIEMRLEIEEGRQMSEQGRREKNTAVGQVGVNSVVRVPQGRRLWLGAFQREAQGRAAARPDQVRLFVIQARAVGSEALGPGGGAGPPPLTAAQYERVQRAFVRPERHVSP